MTTLVIGCGNPLRGDDAVGVNVVQRLQAHALPDGVRCVDAGTSGLEVVLLIQDADRVIFIDAAASDGTTPPQPGRIHERSPDDLTAGDSWPPGGVSMHAVRWDQALALAKAIGYASPAHIQCFLIEGGSFDHGSPLSREVETAAEQLVQRLLQELSSEVS